MKGESGRKGEQGAPGPRGLPGTPGQPGKRVSIILERLFEKYFSPSCAENEIKILFIIIYFSILGKIWIGWITWSTRTSWRACKCCMHVHTYFFFFFTLIIKKSFKKIKGI